MALKDKVAVITGAARGMGRAHTKSFLEEGAKVVAIDLSWEPTGFSGDQDDAFFRLLNSRPNDALTVTCDIGDPEQVQAAYDAAMADKQSAEAQINQARAQVKQQQAAVEQARLDLQHTVIVAPIDGTVIARNVDAGQTVAASLQAPTLFTLARDLAEMELEARVDEADIGRIQAGQSVSFGVDAYGGEKFKGKVRQVRLEPVVEQNVVSYVTVVDVPNPDLKLKPGMTATVTVEVWIRPLASVAGTRCTRCTPLSYLSRLYAPRPSTDAITSFKPPTPVSLVDSRSILQPCRSAYFAYMRNNSAANSAASSPPVPARISSTTFFSSLGSRGSRSRFSSSSRAASSRSPPARRQAAQSQTVTRCPSVGRRRKPPSPAAPKTWAQWIVIRSLIRRSAGSGR